MVSFLLQEARVVLFGDLWSALDFRCPDHGSRRAFRVFWDEAGPLGPRPDHMFCHVFEGPCDR